MISDAANTPGFVSTEQMHKMEAGGFDIQTIQIIIKS